MDRTVCLAALNAEWGTSYADWDAIQPETTRQTMRRGDDNFAAWNDFKTWMDTSYADALRFGTTPCIARTRRARAGWRGADPAGAAMNYTKLADVVDVMELYVGNE